MVLRKDKVASALQAMRGMCSDPTAQNALPDVMGQLANILGDLFDDIALPALDDLPGIDTGQDEPPVEEEEELEEPVGEGEPLVFDPRDGFEEPPPGGGARQRRGRGCTPWRRSAADARRDGPAGDGLAVRMVDRFGSAVRPPAPRGSDRMAAKLLARQDFHRLDVQRLAKLSAFSCRKLWISIPLRNTLRVSNEAHSTNEKRHDPEHQPLRRRDP